MRLHIEGSSGTEQSLALHQNRSDAVWKGLWRSPTQSHTWTKTFPSIKWHRPEDWQEKGNHDKRRDRGREALGSKNPERKCVWDQGMDMYYLDLKAVLRRRASCLLLDFTSTEISHRTMSQMVSCFYEFHLPWCISLLSLVLNIRCTFLGLYIRMAPKTTRSWSRTHVI